MNAPIPALRSGPQGQDRRTSPHRTHQPLCGNRVPSRTGPGCVFPAPGTTAFTSLGSQPIRGLHVPGLRLHVRGGVGRLLSDRCDWRGGAEGHTVNDRRACFHGVGRDAHPAGGWRDRVLLQHGYGRFHHDSVGELPLWRKDCRIFSQDAWYAKTQLFRDSFDGPICTRTHGQRLTLPRLGVS